MFTIENKQLNSAAFVTLKGINCEAKLNLNEGGRLQNLSFNKKNIIKEDASFEYSNSYASAVLFPFANRIRNGTYEFKNKQYQFFCNESGGGNALHGLVFNKKFTILEKEIGVRKCAVTLVYNTKKSEESFPFTYTIFLTYTLSSNNLSLSVTVKNTSTETFPFTLGWHPYFFTDTLKESTLNFKTIQKVEFDEQLITTGLLDCKEEKNITIANNQLDDSYVLKDDTVHFTTSEYQLKITSSVKENYLQLYTPKSLPLIAIEPMTGISDSFNNKIGLQELAADKKYTVTWNLKITTN